MKEMKNSDSNEEPLPELNAAQEHEFSKLKFLIGYGGTVFEQINKDLSAEIEGEFMDYAEEFDRAFKNRKIISVYNKLGRPEFIEACYLNDEEIALELKRIEAVLEEHNMVLDVICEYENIDRLLYTFITEELFFEEMDDMKVKGMITHFIYEEFHQNHTYDIEEACRSFLKSYFDKVSDYYELYVKNEFENPVQLSAFRAAFATFTMYKLEFTEVLYDAEEALTSFDIDFSGVLKKSSEILSFKGEGIITFDYKYGFWYVKNVELPMG